MAPTPALDRLERAFRTHAPVFRDVVERQRRLLGTEWALRFDADIARILPTEAKVNAAVQGYTRFARELLRMQLRFEQEGEYVARSYTDVAATVYGDSAYMTSCYLPGLLLSHYLWPHQYRQLRFFEDTFVAEMRAAGSTTFYDVGTGTGMYSRAALVAAPRATGVAFDVSPASGAFADHHVGIFGTSARFRVEVRDVQRDPVPPADWLVCVEVLEHLPDPVPFIRALRDMVIDGGKGFITAAINAPHTDHVYHYRSVEAVMAHVVEGGFVIEQYFGAYAHPPREPGLPVAEVAAFVVT